MLLLVGEAVADQQMWNFQQDKKRRLAAGEDVDRPFITTGLFRYCRHPNFVCEMGMWWVFYLFAVAASGEWLHWTALGFIGLTLQFIPAMRMSESISVAKYPGYRDYQATTPALIPLPRTKRGSSTVGDGAEESAPCNGTKCGCGARSPGAVGAGAGRRVRPLRARASRLAALSPSRRAQRAVIENAAASIRCGRPQGSPLRRGGGGNGY